jgi:putative endonuclease
MIDFLTRRKTLLADSKKLGRWGEKRCEKFLRKKGLKKLEGNYSCRAGEIDLIMVDKSGAIVFVEVKTRKDETFAATEDVITSTKQQRMTRAARYFLSSHNIENRPYRFDVATIVLGQKGRGKINHYENAFIA